MLNLLSQVILTGINIYISYLFLFIYILFYTTNQWFMMISKQWIPDGSKDGESDAMWVALCTSVTDDVRLLTNVCRSVFADADNEDGDVSVNVLLTVSATTSDWHSVSLSHDMSATLVDTSTVTSDTIFSDDWSELAPLATVSVTTAATVLPSTSEAADDDNDLLRCGYGCGLQCLSLQLLDVALGSLDDTEDSVTVLSMSVVATVTPASPVAVHQTPDAV